MTEAQRRRAVRGHCNDMEIQLAKRVDKHLVGPAFYRAMLCERILAWLVQIDESTGPAVVRFITETAWSWLNDVAPGV